MNIDMNRLAGSDFRVLREKKGLSQAKFSRLSRISQSRLSAFELDKLQLSNEELTTLVEIISDDIRIESFTSKKKQYQKHIYNEINRNLDRTKLATKSNNNPLYLNEISQLFINHKSDKKNNLKALSLFSGCGGLSLGFSAAGYSIRGFLELDPELRKIYKANFEGCYEIGGDITNVSDKDLINAKEKIGEIDIIIGGPPCQGFSLSGKRDTSDPRNQLFRHYLRVVEVFQPKLALIENVRLLSSMKSAENSLVKDDIKNEFKEKGYKIKSFEVNAKNFGVPQHRERIFFIAVKDDVQQEIIFADQTHGTSLFDMPYRTFSDACSDLEYLESGEESSKDKMHFAVKHPTHVINWLWDVKQGHSAHENLDEKNRPPSGYNTTYKRQVWNEPASTVQTTFGMISGCRNVHPIATRSLSIREAARIQSFPDEYNFFGTLGTIRKGIGNAVPPLLANKIALHLKSFF
jgi:DNA (cytosine-5)-methyltransferase 1